MNGTSYTLDFINRSLNLPAGDRRLERLVDSCLRGGRSVDYCLAACRANLMVNALAPPSSSSAGPMAQPPGRSVTISQIATLRQQARAMHMTQTSAPTAPRRPDPVTDPFLAANDFAEELGRWLKLDDKAVAALPVRAYMLWVAIRAAQKDGAPWHDMDAALHDMAGVEYVVPPTPHAAAAGALYLAEWATVDSERDTITLYMREDLAYVITDQMVDELGASRRVSTLLQRAPVITATWDFNSDDLILTDGKTRRRLSRTWVEHHGALTLNGISPNVLARIWAAAQPL